MSTFKAGDKVKVVAGSWGIHPIFEGREVTIARVWQCPLAEDGCEYQIEETLDGYDTCDGRHVNQVKPIAWGQSFRAIDGSFKDSEVKPKKPQTPKRKIVLLGSTFRWVNVYMDANGQLVTPEGRMHKTEASAKKYGKMGLDKPSWTYVQSVRVEIKEN